MNRPVANLEEAYRLTNSFAYSRFRLTFKDGTVRHCRIAKNSPQARVRIYIMLARRTSIGGYQVTDSELASIERTQ